MFKIVKKRELNPTVTEMVIEAPLIAKKAKAGQFIIIRAKEDSERIPLTIAHYDAAAGTVAIIFQIVGAGTMQLNSLKEGEYVHDFVGPLGKATEIEGLKNVCVVGGGVGCAIALPVAQALKAQGTKVTGIIGFRNKDLVILEDEFRACPLCWMPPGCSCVCLMQSRCTTLHWSMAALARPLCLMASWPPTC